MSEQQLTDKTGAPATVTKRRDRFVIEVEGATAALTMFLDREGQRVFYHTESKEEFAGRGLASLLVNEALEATRAEGLRIVPVCPLVAAHVKKHREFDAIVDQPTPEILTWLDSQLR